MHNMQYIKFSSMDHMWYRWLSDDVTYNIKYACVNMTHTMFKEDLCGSWAKCVAEDTFPKTYVTRWTNDIVVTTKMQQDVCDQFLQSLIHPHVCFVTSEQHCGNEIFLLFRVLGIRQYKLFRSRQYNPPQITNEFAFGVTL